MEEQLLLELIHAGDGVAVELGDDVVGLDAGLLARAAGGDVYDVHAGREAVILGGHAVNVLAGDAEGRVAGLGVEAALAGDYAVGYPDRVVDGDREAEALGAVLIALGGDDADNLAAGVVHRTAGVAFVDGGVDLEHGHGAFLGGDESVGGGDHATGHGVAQLAERVAHGVHRVAHKEAVAAAELGGVEAGGVDLQHRDVVVAVKALDLGGVGAAVVEHDLDLIAAGVGVLDDVVVREDVAVLADDEAGTGDGAGDGHAEDVGGGDVGLDADDLLAGEVIVDVARAHGSVGAGGGAAGAGAGLHQGLVGGRGVGLADHGRRLVGVGDQSAGYAAQQSADQAQGDDACGAYAALVGLLLRLGRFGTTSAGDVITVKRGIALRSVCRVTIAGVMVGVGFHDAVAAVLSGGIAALFAVVPVFRDVVVFIIWVHGSFLHEFLFTCVIITASCDLVMNKHRKIFEVSE